MHIYAYVCELTSLKRAVRWQRLRAVRAAVGPPALSLVVVVVVCCLCWLLWGVSSFDYPPAHP